MFIFFNSTFLPLFAAGLPGMARRVVYYPANSTLNVFVSISAFCLGISMLVFLFNLVYSLIIKPEKAEQNPWNSKGIEWSVPHPVHVENFPANPDMTDFDPYEYGTPTHSSPGATPAPAGA